MLNIIFILIGVILLFNFIKVLAASKSPLKKASVSMFAGAASLAAASLITGLLGVQIMVNLFTVFISLVLGVPGVVLILLKTFLI
ncbi:MAG: pro-sigmaK processing inhibitor BofA family protein [Oscillospiraceae bacterium]|nr:pro-sigmaK processing inhibitor BofA family protein [Oscillospiraceae bacterium]